MSIQMTPPAGILQGQGAAGKTFYVQQSTGMANVDDDSVSALLAADWKIPPQALPTPGKPGQPYILAQSAVPVILLPAGTVNGSGQITLGTALPYVPSGVVWVYVFAGIGLAAGLYQATFSSTTVCQLVDNPATTAGAYAGGTGTVNLVNAVVPGGAMGPNGAVRITGFAYTVNNANSKAVSTLFAGGLYSGSTLAATLGMYFGATIRNRGSQQAQITHSNLNMFGTTGIAQVLGTADTSKNQTLAIQVQSSVATDYIILEGYTVEILPGA